ncbi:MAG: helicase-related protein, partial [Alphaproteobacteria bacterium]
MVQIKTDPGLTAILGPTNTGKTFYAIERMLSYRSGIIGFPLRLLAKENYDKVCSRVGSRNVALLTGEEKITPKTARYLICTVESMPLDWPADFIAIDEIQFCADPERGYIYSNRLFRARGLRETMFLGAETIRPVLEKLIPEIKIETRSRFSKLSWAGVKKLSRIPKRSAVVAFSTNDVYAIAEGIRRGRGGAAVVLGALSPRARNAQVAMYEGGEVDYLVATDAIGMGLNMDIEHVLFSSLKKFDGSKFRTLDMQEIAQIAGRAGRHTRDGTFGSLPEVGEFEPDLISAIETHNFPSIRQIWWRNANLEFRSLRDLLVSLEDVPQSGILIKKRDAEDHRALRKMANLNDITRLASGRERLRLLWEVCQIPDFRKTLADAHINLLKR